MNFSSVLTLKSLTQLLGHFKCWPVLVLHELLFTLHQPSLLQWERINYALSGIVEERLKTSKIIKGVSPHIHGEWKKRGLETSKIIKGVSPNTHGEWKKRGLETSKIIKGVSPNTHGEWKKRG